MNGLTTLSDWTYFRKLESHSKASSQLVPSQKAIVSVETFQNNGKIYRKWIRCLKKCTHFVFLKLIALISEISKAIQTYKLTGANKLRFLQEFWDLYNNLVLNKKLYVSVVFLNIECTIRKVSWPRRSNKSIDVLGVQHIDGEWN